MNPPELLPFVADLRANPGDDALRAILADLLDEVEPEEAKLHRTPEWFRLCWCRLTVPLPSWGRSNRPAAWAVHQEVDGLLGNHSDCISRWDHWGTATVAGLECLVSEPYTAGKNACRVFAPLAEVLPCCAHAWARRGAWHPATVRAILFPPLVMPPPRKRQRRKTWEDYP